MTEKREKEGRKEGGREKCDRKEGEGGGEGRGGEKQDGKEGGVITYCAFLAQNPTYVYVYITLNYVMTAVQTHVVTILSIQILP